jgi:hypothetical protein
MERRRKRTEIQLTRRNQVFPKHGMPGKRDISCPARRPDMSACDLFLLGYWKSKFMLTAPAKLLSAWTENS